jgi:hypothetical protein
MKHLARRGRRHLLPRVAFSAIVIGSLTAVAAAPASAVVQDAITVDVASSVLSSVPVSGGNCQWTVSSDVKVFNLTNPAVTITYTQAWPTISWVDDDTNTSGIVSGAGLTILNDGGLHAGDTLPGPQFNSATYSPYEVQFTIPCDADFGELEVHIKTDGGSNTSGASVFLENGTAVPAVPIAAALGATALAGTFLFTRRRRKPAIAGRQSADQQSVRP